MTGTAWRNRIVGQGEEQPDQLLANPGNWRIHPQAQQSALKGVLDEVGWVQQVIVNRTTGHLVDGHLRVTLAMRDNQPRIPVVYVELSEAEEAEILATLDPIGAMAVADREKLDTLMHEVQSGEAAVQQMLEGLAKREGLGYDFPDVVDNTGLEDDRTNRLEPGKGQAIISIGTWSGKVDYELVQALAERIKGEYGDNADDALGEWCREYVGCPAGG